MSGSSSPQGIRYSVQSWPRCRRRKSCVGRRRSNAGNGLSLEGGRARKSSPATGGPSHETRRSRGVRQSPIATRVPAFHWRHNRRACFVACGSNRRGRSIGGRSAENSNPLPPGPGKLHVPEVRPRQDAGHDPARRARSHLPEVVPSATRCQAGRDRGGRPKVKAAGLVLYGGGVITMKTETRRHPGVRVRQGCRDDTRSPRPRRRKSCR